MKIFIAGGAGFVGTNLARHWAHQYPRYELLLFDNLSTGKNEHVTDLVTHKNIQFVQGDISNLAEVQQSLNKFDPTVVINTVYPLSEENAINTYIVGNHNLLNGAKAICTNLKKFIFISSDDVYGDIVSEDGHLRPGTEEDHIQPNTVTATAQSAADLFTTTYFKQYQLPTTVIRPSSLFGPYQNEQRLLSKLITHAMKNENIPVYGDGTHTRTWLFIEDFVQLVDKIIHAPTEDTSGNIYNASTNTAHSILETTETILTILNKPKELITFSEGEYPSARSKVIDSTKAQEQLQWDLHTDFKDAIKQTIDWYESRVLK